MEQSSIHGGDSSSPPPPPPPVEAKVVHGYHYTIYLTPLYAGYGETESEINVIAQSFIEAYRLFAYAYPGLSIVGIRLQSKYGETFIVTQ